MKKRNLNDRPVRYRHMIPTFHSDAQVPVYYASKSKWRSRGYAVKDGERETGHVETWNGMHWQYYDLYHISQVREIEGVKAAIRRGRF